MGQVAIPRMINLRKSPYCKSKEIIVLEVFL